MTKLLLVEDDRKLAAAITRGLQEEGFAVLHATNGDEGLSQLRSGGVDVCVLDGGLPGRDGFDVLSTARAEGNQTPVVMLTARDETVDRVRGLDLGADDYLVKPFAFDELVARLRAVLRRRPSKEGHLEFGDVMMDTATRRVTRSGRAVELPLRQFLLLEFLLRRGERVATRAEILRDVWGYDFDPGTNVVDVHIAALRQKLEEEGESILIRTVRGVGYALTRGAP